MKVVRASALVAAVVVTIGLAGALPAQAAAPTPPVQVITQLTDQTVDAGADATFTAAAQDAVPADVPVTTWQSKPSGGSTWSDVPGSAGQGTLTVTSVTSAQDGTSYRALFDDGLSGTLATDAAVLNVHYGPQVTTQPQNKSVVRAGAFTLTAAATGNPTPTIKWQTADSATGPWTDVPGATSTTYNGAAPDVANATVWYRAVFTNSVATVATAVVTVTTGDDPPLAVDYVDADNPGAGQLHASWPAPDAGGPVDHYSVRANHGGVPVKTVNTTSRSYTFTGLSAGTYQVSVVAVNDTGGSDETFSAAVTVRTLKQTGTVSATILRPYHDGFQDTVTLRATSTFPASGTAHVLNSAGKVVRSFTISKRTSFSASFNGRSSSGHALAFGHYRVRFTLGGHVVSTRNLTLSKTQSSLSSASWSPSTVYPVHDGYQDTTKLTLRTNMPATMTITITKSGSSSAVASHKIPLRTLGAYTWSAKKGGKPLPAGHYRAKIVVKGGDGSPRTTYKNVTVSGKRLVASKWKGYITASNAYVEAASGSPVALGGGRVGFYSFADGGLPDDVGVFGVRLPSSYQYRYSHITISGCVDPNYPKLDNEVEAVLLNADGEGTSHDFQVPDSGCSQPISVSPSYLYRSAFLWGAGNVSGNDDFGVVDEFDITATIYKLK